MTMPRSRWPDAPAGDARYPEEGDLLRPVELLSKFFEGPEGGVFGLEQVLERLEWKETTR